MIRVYNKHVIRNKKNNLLMVLLKKVEKSKFKILKILQKSVDKVVIV